MMTTKGLGINEKIMAYLPYRPRVQWVNPVDGLSNIAWINNVGYFYFLMDTYQAKLILTPMSEVVKPFTYNGETFVPLDRLSPYYRENYKEFLKKLHSRHLTYRMMTQLIAWGFDVFNMIDAGEAVAENKERA